MAGEKRFEETLKRWLTGEGIYALGTPKQDMIAPPCGYWEKRWGGGKYIKAGLPDMHIVVCGISIEAELKDRGNTPSEVQKQKINQIHSAGCISLVLYPKDFPRFQAMVRFLKLHHGDELKRICEDAVITSGMKGGWKV